MGNASFMQSSFLGGMWSETAQGRMDDPAYKAALNECFNALPLEQGAWTRRPGFSFLAHTRDGLPAKLVPFDYQTSQPYQLELTPLVARVFADLAQVTVPNENVTVLNVSAANPAVVSFAGAGTGWANDDQIVFKLNSVPCTAPYLCGRQFIIADFNAGAKTFTLKDVFTNAYIDGADVAYSLPTGEPDDIERIFEMTTPYGTDDISSVRYTQDDDHLILLHPSYIPQVITQGAPFSIADAVFVDGPYLDVNETATTLTPSGTTGSITLTASDTAGINSNAGFQSTDVGRLLRFKAEPADWASGTSYGKGTKVTATDGNIYESVSGSNLGNNPSTDDGTNWQITADTIIWTWGKITAVGSTTSITWSISGDDLPSTLPATEWRLGVFSDTTGWPTNAAFHEGRLWLAGAVSNRFDASRSNTLFDFTPTSPDGTVADGSAISETIKARESNPVLWMLSTADGLMLGSQGGEWRIRASVLDNALSPFNIQARLVSSYGCADMCPADTPYGTVFMQRQKRKLLRHEQVSASDYHSEHLSKNGADLTAGGIEEIAWQAEPLSVVWMRRADGTLIGCSQKKSPRQGDSYTAMHYHALANGRTITSISAGPAYDGLSDSLFIVSNQLDSTQPDAGVHWVQAMRPVFDAGQQDWAAFFTDGGGNPCCITQLKTSVGDSINGIVVYGLWHLNGITVTPVLGGLDLGDYVVADGKITVEFGSSIQPLFTKAFFDALNLTTDYSVFGISGSSKAVLLSTAVEAADSIGAYVGDQGAFTDQTYNTVVPDEDGEFIYVVSTSSSGTAGGIRKFNAFGDYAEVANQSISQIFGADGSLEGGFARPCYHPGDGKLYAFMDNAATSRLAKINASDLSLDRIFGYSSGVLNGSNYRTLSLGYYSILPVSVRDKNYIITIGSATANQTNEVTLTDVGLMEFREKDTISQAKAYPVRGYQRDSSKSTFYVVGDVARPATTPLTLYKYDVTYEGSLVKSTMGTISPAQIDATWTNIGGTSSPLFDEVDGNIVMFVSTTDSVTNKNYIVKIRHDTGDLVFATAIAITTGPGAVPPGYGTNLKLTSSRFVVFTGGDAHKFSLSNGVDTTYTGFHDVLGTSTTQIYDDASGSVLLLGDWVWTGGTPTFLGTWMQANGASPAGGYKKVRLFFGYEYGSNETATWVAPASIGTTYESRGQLLRPDYGIDAGARNGPAFAKLRRLHWFGSQFVRSRQVEIGVNFTDMFVVKLQDAGGTEYAEPTLFSGVVSDTIESDYSFGEKIAWRCTRPYPCTVAALSGFIQSTDK